MATSFPGGLDAYTNPTASDVLNQPGVTHVDQHSNINDAMEAVQTKVGVDFSAVTTSLDYIVNLLMMTVQQHYGAGYREIEYATNIPVLPDTITWYTNSGKTVKLIDKEFVYAGSIPVIPTSIILRIYDGTSSNNVERTITDVISYSGVFEISRTRTVS